jgi:hypothetical protein
MWKERRPRWLIVTLTETDAQPHVRCIGVEVAGLLEGVQLAAEDGQLLVEALLPRDEVPQRLVVVVVEDPLKTARQGRQAGRQTDTQTDRQTVRQADRQTVGQSGRQSDRQTDRQK